LQAFNLNGPSPFSQCVECLTPAAVPAAIAHVRVDEVKSDSIVVAWKQPNSNGDTIASYNIDISDSFTSSSSSSSIVFYSDKLNCEYKLNKLQADTVYKIRIQAANAMGVGPFSSAVKAKTKALVPTAPHLELVSCSYNSIKLKWTPQHSVSTAAIDFKIDNEIFYSLDMRNLSDATSDSNGSFSLAYKGPLNLFKCTKLQESTTYLFRVAATNESGQGEWSDVCKVSTTKSPPIINKAPLATGITFNSCQIEWTPAKQPAKTDVDSNQAESVEYILQLQKSAGEKNNSDYKEVYRGTARSCHLKDLTPNTEYNVRVCSLRTLTTQAEDLSTSQRICSPASPHTSFLTLKQNNHKNLSPKNSTDSKSAPASAANNNSNGGGPRTTDSATTKSSSSQSIVGSLLSRFMWPSFYLNLNSESSATKKMLTTAAPTNDHHHHKSNKHLLKRHSINRINVINATTTTSESPGKTNHTNTKNANSNNRTMRDKQWAILLLFALVIIAFFTAFSVNTVYTSFYQEQVSASSSSSSN
jgi:hypothetical protein